MSASSAALESLCAYTRRLLEARERVLLAIDGRCGSGKTTLAAALVGALDGTLLHTDDFYLPFSRRQEGWEHLPAANMDLDRIRTQLLEPARRGETILYRPYRCMDDRRLPEKRLPPRRLTVLEGSYAHHPALAGLYDGRVFLTCAPETQIARLRAREGAGLRAFQTRWIPLEEAFFRQFSIEEKAELVLRTDEAPGCCSPGII